MVLGHEYHLQEKIHLGMDRGAGVGMEGTIPTGQTSLDFTLSRIKINKKKKKKEELRTHYNHHFLNHSDENLTRGDVSHI